MPIVSAAIGRYTSLSAALLYDSAVVEDGFRLMRIVRSAGTSRSPKL